jgi:hypothetical protein
LIEINLAAFQTIKVLGRENYFGPLAGRGRRRGRELASPSFAIRETGWRIAADC